MKFTPSVIILAISAGICAIASYVIGCTTIVFAYHVLGGQLSPLGAAGWCSRGTAVMGFAPNGCGMEDGALALAALFALGFLACGGVALTLGFIAGAPKPAHASQRVM